MQSHRPHPVIGLTTYGRNADNRYTLPAEYIDAVRRAGGVPVLLPPGEERWTLGLQALDGLILTGGGDIDPARYGGKGHPTNYAIDSERDAMEIRLASQVLESGLPTLGICRGTQILNIVLGGTLIEHLPDEVGEQVLHRAPPREPIRHRVSVQPDSRLAQIAGSTDFEVASWHHQALRKVADPFTVVATAPDNTIEAVEIRNHPWLIAVQWHPELTAASEPIQQRLFDAVVQAARER